MCRLLGYCSRGSSSVAGLLTEEGLRAFTELSAFHGDGWGMAWYNSDGPQVQKSARRALEEPDYARLAARPLGDLGLVHLRWATPGLGIGYDNSHPFRYGRYTFAHNGAVHPQDRLGEMLPAAWERRLAGATDSERYLLHIMWRRRRHRRGDRRILPPRLPGHGGRGGRGKLRVAPARLDRAADRDRARRGPGHAGHIGDLARVTRAAALQRRVGRQVRRRRTGPGRELAGRQQA